MEPRPTDAYGRSKLAAEQGLAALDLDWVALRLVLVFGPGMKGNMAALARLARAPYSLPFGGLTSPRSLLSLANLAAAIDAVLSAPQALRRPLIVADPEPLSIAEMVAAMRSGLGRKPGLIPIPPSVLGAALRSVGRRDLYERMAGPLVADASALAHLGWIATANTRAELAALMRDV
jgi:UDP-glucose 4-epimerase